MEKERGGWWGLFAAASTALLLGTYIGAYYVSVRVSFGRELTPAKNGAVVELLSSAYPKWLGSWGDRIFHPVHLMDRRIRPSKWSRLRDPQAVAIERSLGVW